METKYIISLGLNDKDTKKQKFTNRKSKRLLIKVLRKHMKGYSIVFANGGYLHNDKKTFVNENSFIISLLFVENQLQVSSLIDELLKVFNQESIMVETQETNVCFATNNKKVCN